MRWHLAREVFGCEEVEVYATQASSCTLARGRWGYSQVCGQVEAQIGAAEMVPQFSQAMGNPQPDNVGTLDAIKCKTVANQPRTLSDC